MTRCKTGADVISQSESMALSRWWTMASKLVLSWILEAIEQVGAEAPLGNGLVEGGVGGGNEEDIDLG